MEKINSFFLYYDNWLAHFSKTDQIIISSLLLLFVIWQIFLFFKSGKWIFLLIILVFLPSIWPFIKIAGRFIWTLMTFFITRIQSNI